MGIELITSDETFLNFVRNVLREQGTEMKEPATPEPMPEYEIITCNGCGVRNKVSREKLSRDPQCGRCGTVLITEMP
jgi:transposase